MCRLAMCERQNHPGDRWFADCPPAANLFRQIKDFEPDCRLFLNCLNSWLGPDQLIFSPPAIRVFIADREVFKPDDEKYSCFWVDFRYIKKIIDVQNQCWGIRIRKIRMFLGLPDPLVTSRDPDPFIIKQK